MPRFKLLIEYTGTRYSGWQIQKNARTVQGEIDRAVREVAKRGEFELYGSGRTDAGVHALAQVAHLELYTDLPPESLRRKLNDELPADIHIRGDRQGRRTVFTRATTPCRGATCIRSHAAGPPSRSPSSGGSVSRSTCRPCARQPPRSSA